MSDDEKQKVIKFIDYIDRNGFNFRINTIVTMVIPIMYVLAKQLLEDEEI